MNYIELINKFWLAHDEHCFRPTDIALYFKLLDINNSCSWKNPFKRNNKKIEADLGISFNTLKDSRNRLKQAGQIDFRTQNGSPTTTYTLSKFDEVESEVSDKVLSGSASRFSRGSYEVSTSKDKLKETKLNETDKSIENAQDKKNGDDRLPWEIPRHELEAMRNPPVAEAPLLSEFDLIEQDCLSAIAWQQELGKFLSLQDLPTVAGWLTKFFEMLRAGDDMKRNLSETKLYARNWIKTKIEKSANDKSNTNRPSQSTGKINKLLSANQRAKERARLRYEDESAIND